MSEPVQEGAPGAALDDGMLGTLARLSSQFFADAAAVDSAASVPVAHLDALAAAGLYGIFAPVSEGGLGLGYPETCAAVEELASSCLASTFVWRSIFLSSGRCSTPPHRHPCVRRCWLPLSEAKSREAWRLRGYCPARPD